MAIWVCRYTFMWLCVCVAIRLRGYVAMWICDYVLSGYLAMWPRGPGALGLYGYVSMWLCGHVARSEGVADLC